MGYGPQARLRKGLRAGFFAAVAFVAGLCAAGLGAGGQARAEPLELVALGDSLTQGYGLLPHEGLVAQLQQWLAARGADVRVVNAGVSGDTSAGGRARLGWSLNDYTDALIIELGGNDLLRGIAPAQTRANIEAMLAEAQGRGVPVLLIGLKAPGNFGADWQAEFDAIWPELAARYNAVLLADLLAPIGAKSPEARAAEELMQADGIHPSARGVELVVEALGPKVLELLARATPRG